MMTNTSVVPKFGSTTASAPNFAPIRQYPLISGGSARSAARGSARGLRQRGDVEAPPVAPPRAPFRARRRVAAQIAHRRGVFGRLGALQAGAAEHRIDAMMLDIGPDAAPQQFQRRLASIVRGDAGAAELEKAFAGVARDQRGDVKLARAVKAEIRLCDILAQQPIGADDPRRAAAPPRAAVDDDQVVANPVELADVAANEPRGRIGEPPPSSKKTR